MYEYSYRTCALASRSSTVFASLFREREALVAMELVEESRWKAPCELPARAREVSAMERPSEVLGQRFEEILVCLADWKQTHQARLYL